MPRLALILAALVSASAVQAADYPPPVVRRVPPGERWISSPPPAPPPVVRKKDVEVAPPPLIERRVTRERRSEDRMVTEERHVEHWVTPPPVIERFSSAPADIVVTPAPVPEVSIAPPPPCAPAIVDGLAEAPFWGAPVEGLAVGTGPGVEFQQLAHLFNGQPVMSAREGSAANARCIRSAQ